MKGPKRRAPYPLYRNEHNNFLYMRCKLSNMIPELWRIIAAYGHMLMYAIATHDGMAKCSSSLHYPAPRKRSSSIVVSSSHSSNKQQIATSQSWWNPHL